MSEHYATQPACESGIPARGIHSRRVRKLFSDSCKIVIADVEIFLNLSTVFNNSKIKRFYL